MRYRLLGQGERGGHIEVKGRIQVAGVKIEKGPLGLGRLVRWRSSDVVDENVEPAKLCQRLFHYFCGIRRIPQVADNREGTTTELSHLSRHRVEVGLGSRHQYHVRPRLSQHARAGCPDTPPGSADDRHPVGNEEAV